MGRGLSPLQRTVLTLALRNHDAEQRAFEPAEGADVYVPEVYVAAYGWVVRDPRRARHPGMKADPPPGGWRGNARAVRAAVARATKRLEARGLVRRVYHAWSGAALTPAGYTAAQRLSVTADVPSAPAVTERPM